MLTQEVVVQRKDSEAETKKSEAQAMEIAAKLEEEIAQGQAEIETVGKKIIIRIQQKDTFRSGSDYIEDRFLPVIDKIREALVTIPGRISVEGHTEDIPLKGVELALELGAIHVHAQLHWLRSYLLLLKWTKVVFRSWVMQTNSRSLPTQMMLRAHAIGE